MTVVAVCDKCGKYRVIRGYGKLSTLCKSCAKKASMNDETRKKISVAHKGKPRPWLQGKNSSSWKGGISPWRNQLAGTIPYANWRTAIFKRDDYTCQICGERSGKLQAHHIWPMRDNINTLLIFDIDNGITLCKDCHISISGHEKEFESFFDTMIQEKRRWKGKWQGKSLEYVKIATWIWSSRTASEQRGISMNWKQDVK